MNENLMENPSIASQKFNLDQNLSIQEHNLQSLTLEGPHMHLQKLMSNQPKDSVKNAQIDQNNSPFTFNLNQNLNYKERDLNGMNLQDQDSGTFLVNKLISDQDSKLNLDNINPIQQNVIDTNRVSPHRDINQKLEIFQYANRFEQDSNRSRDNIDSNRNNIDHGKFQNTQSIQQKQLDQSEQDSESYLTIQETFELHSIAFISNQFNQMLEVVDMQINDQDYLIQETEQDKNEKTLSSKNNNTMSISQTFAKSVVDSQINSMNQVSEEIKQKNFLIEKYVTLNNVFGEEFAQQQALLKSQIIHQGEDGNIKYEIVPDENNDKNEQRFDSDNNAEQEEDKLNDQFDRSFIQNRSNRSYSQKVEPRYNRNVRSLSQFGKKNSQQLLTSRYTSKRIFEEKEFLKHQENQINRKQFQINEDLLVMIKNMLNYNMPQVNPSSSLLTYIKNENILMLELLEHSIQRQNNDEEIQEIIEKREEYQMSSLEQDPQLGVNAQHQIIQRVRSKTDAEDKLSPNRSNRVTNQNIINSLENRLSIKELKAQKREYLKQLIKRLIILVRTFDFVLEDQNETKPKSKIFQDIIPDSNQQFKFTNTIYEYVTKSLKMIFTGLQIILDQVYYKQSPKELIQLKQQFEQLINGLNALDNSRFRNYKSNYTNDLGKIINKHKDSEGQNENDSDDEQKSQRSKSQFENYQNRLLQFIKQKLADNDNAQEKISTRSQFTPQDSQHSNLFSSAAFNEKTLIRNRDRTNTVDEKHYKSSRLENGSQQFMENLALSSHRIQRPSMPKQKYKNLQDVVLENDEEEYQLDLKLDKSEKHGSSNNLALPLNLRTSNIAQGKPIINDISSGNNLNRANLNFDIQVDRLDSSLNRNDEQLQTIEGQLQQPRKSQFSQILKKNNTVNLNNMSKPQIADQRINDSVMSEDNQI